MNKTVVWFATVLLIVAGGGLVIKSAAPDSFLYPIKAFFTGEISYVADVTSEIDMLEDELTNIDRQLAEGSLTSEAAAAARDKVIVRIDRINEVLQNAGKQAVPEETKARLRDALSKLTNVLTKYQHSLTKLDEVADGSVSTETRRLNPRGGSGGKSLASIIAKTIEDLADHIEEVTDDEVSDEVEDIIEDVLSEESSSEEETEEGTSTYEEISTEEEVNEETSSETEEDQDTENSGTTTEELIAE